MPSNDRPVSVRTNRSGQTVRSQSLPNGAIVSWTSGGVSAIITPDHGPVEDRNPNLNDHLRHGRTLRPGEDLNPNEPYHPPPSSFPRRMFSQEYHAQPHHPQPTEPITRARETRAERPTAAAARTFDEILDQKTARVKESLGRNAFGNKVKDLAAKTREHFNRKKK
jgi:hypothetical protein